MDVITCIIAIAIIYGVLYFFDIFFKTCAHYPYLQFLNGTGFEIKFFQLRWTTTALNRLLLRWGSGNSKFFNVWFSLGLCTSLILLPVSIILLFVSIAQNLFFSNINENGKSAQVLDTVVPGIDFPASELGYYSLTLIVCSLFHEIGHALCAVREDIHLNFLGVTFFFILPVAFVNISKDRLMSLNPWRALRIMCAGIWHNIVLSFLAYLLFLSVPYIFTLFFDTNSGITVTFISKNSPLYGVKGLMVGDVVQRINDCDVMDEDSWYDCLKALEHIKPELCVHADIIHTLDESIPLKMLPNGVYDCCGQEKPSHLCFEYIDRDDGVLEIPPHVCLPGRTVVEKSSKFCNGGGHCPNQMHCIKPMFDNFTNLFKIARYGSDDVIYIGHATDMVRTLQVSSFIPKYLFSTTIVPDAIMKFLKYVIIFSLGLSIANVIPCLLLDGEHIVKFLLQILLKNKSSSHTISTVSLIVSLVGTVVLLFHCVHTTFQKILKLS